MLSCFLEEEKVGAALMDFLMKAARAGVPGGSIVGRMMGST